MCTHTPGLGARLAAVSEAGARLAVERDGGCQAGSGEGGWVRLAPGHRGAVRRAEGHQVPGPPQALSRGVLQSGKTYQWQNRGRMGPHPVQVQDGCVLVSHCHVRLPFLCPAALAGFWRARLFTLCQNEIENEKVTNILGSILKSCRNICRSIASVCSLA